MNPFHEMERCLEGPAWRWRCVERIARAPRNSFHGGSKACDQGGQLARQRGVILERLDGRVDGAAGIVAKHHD